MSTDYGREVSCTTSLVTGRLVKGLTLLGEAAYRRLTTPRGALRGSPDEENYGIDLLDFIGASNPRQAAARLPGVITSELLKDERFLNVETKVLLVQNGPASELEISIAIEADDGTFTLKLAVSDVTVELRGIEAAS
jgi:hypothetical protein